MDSYMGNPGRSDGNAAEDIAWKVSRQRTHLISAKGSQVPKTSILGRPRASTTVSFILPIDCPGSRSCSAICTHRQQHSQIPAN